MKLLFAIKALTLPGGGAERVLAEVTAGLADRGHEVVVASFDEPNTEDFYAFDPRARRLRLGIGRAERRSDVSATLARIRQLRRLAGEESPDVAIGFMTSTYIPLAIALAGSSTPVVASEHTVFEYYDDRPVERTLLRGVMPLVDTVTAISESMRQGFPAAIRRKMKIVPNPVRTATLWTSPAGSGQDNILAVGRLETSKDHETLVAAFAHVAPRFPHWRLRIVGEGVLRSSLEAQVASLGLEDRVELPGALADIGAEYRSASIVAIPSRYESFGIVTAEAMAHGVPVIGFADCPGTNELIVNEVNGLLVDGDDRARVLASGLARLMESPELRAQLGLAGPSRAALFAPDKVIDRWELLLDSVRDGRGVP